MEDCLFCKISNKETSTELIYEDKEIVAFHDIHPLTPVHVLIIPKKHIASINNIKEEDIELMGKIILTSKKIADNLGIAENGYKLLFRVGDHGGQEIGHIHLHLLGGAPLREDIGPVREKN
jgi:histidine triad (HIT) family protein